MHLVRKYNPFKRLIDSEQSSSSTSTSARRIVVSTTTFGGASVGLHTVASGDVTDVGTVPTSGAGCVGKRNKSGAADKELKHLSSKIDKLLANLDDGARDDVIFANGDECVICLSAKASMQTQPCGHRVVCRLCFVKTIQVTVAQRTLPLRCVVCRTKILKLKQSPPPAAPSRPASNSVSSGVVGVRPGRSRSSVASSGRSSAVPGAIGLPSRGQPSSAGVTGSSPRHAPTPSKLIQPLLIYPASSVPQPMASTPHCGHHRQLNTGHHQVQHPRRVMSAWSGDDAPQLSALGGFAGSTRTASVLGGRVHLDFAATDVERGRFRGGRSGHAPSASTCSPAPASVSRGQKSK